VTLVIFREEMVDQIVSGVKTQTRRRSKITYKEGRVYQIKLNWFKKTEHHIRILKVFQQRLGDVSHEEARKEGFSSVEGFQAKWVEIYGSWNPDEMVTAYEFKLLENRDQAKLNGLGSRKDQ